jgi:hypothetical protein
MWDNIEEIQQEQYDQNIKSIKCRTKTEFRLSDEKRVKALNIEEGKKRSEILRQQEEGVVEILDKGEWERAKEKRLLRKRNFEELYDELILGKTLEKKLKLSSEAWILKSELQKNE